MSNPLVSVIIPCFNAADYVADAIRSALEQDYAPVEVVVADDGSTDRSLDAIRSFGNRVRLLELPHAGGSAARNAGLGASRGELIQFLDADDLLFPGKLRRQVPFLEQGAADIALCDAAKIEAFVPPGTRSVSSAYAGGDPVVFVLRNDIQTCLPLHRKKNLEAVGGWRPDLPCAQEFDLHLRLACSGCGLHHVPEVLCGVRTVPGSVSDNYLRVLDQFPRILEPAYASLKDAGRLSEERAKTFALVMARAARHYLQRGEPAKAETCFRSARRMHPDGGITGVYNRPARFLRRALGPMAAERLVAFKRAHVGTRRPDPSGPKESAGRAVREGPVTALLILHGFPPSHHSGTLRNTAVARYLPDSGVRPVIFCAADDDRVMPYGRIEDWTDDRRWIEVRRMPWCLTAPDATSLDHRLQLLPVGWTVAHRRARRRVLDRVQAEAGELLRRHRPDVIYASSPPVETLLLAARLAEEYGVPYVCDLRDPWTCDSWIRYRHGLDFAVERNLERSVLSRAAAVIANTPTARRLLVEEIGIPEEKVAIIPNGYDEGEFGELPPRPASPNDRFLVAYTGILSTFRPHVRSAKEALKRALGVDYQPIGNDPNTRSAWWFLEAVGSLLDDRPDLRRRLDIVFAGAHSELDLAVLASFRHPSCLRVLPPLPHRDALDLCARADVCLLFQIEMTRRGTDFCTSIPGKLYEYLRTGTRILAPLQRGDAQEIIEQLDAGVVVPPRDVAAIRAALEAEIARWERGDSPRRPPSPYLLAYERRHLVRQIGGVLRRSAGPQP